MGDAAGTCGSMLAVIFNPWWHPSPPKFLVVLLRVLSGDLVVVSDGLSMVV